MLVISAVRPLMLNGIDVNGGDAAELLNGIDVNGGGAAELLNGIDVNGGGAAELLLDPRPY